jgi:hypothetical protein
MRLPNRTRAYVSHTKLTGYLLSETHKDGKSKAKFLRRLGFNETNVELLERNLIDIAQFEEVKEVVSSAFGIKYIIDGSLGTPGGEFVKMRTVWIIEAMQLEPRFVTAYPLEID